MGKTQSPSRPPARSVARPRPAGRTWVVDAHHRRAGDRGPGSTTQPFKTINAAAQAAQPGDTVLIHAGVYRERVAPARGGEAGRPITYQAAPGAEVCVRGSVEFAPRWKEIKARTGVFRGELKGVQFGAAAYAGVCDPRLYADFNPFRLHFNRGLIARPQKAVVAELRQALAKADEQLQAGSAAADQAASRALRNRDRIQAEIDERTRPRDRKHRLTLGQVFVDGQPLNEVETFEQLFAIAGTWMVSPEGDALLVHPAPGGPALGRRRVEISVRHTAFAPLTRGLGHIHLRGLTFEHAANHFPTWGKTGWAQAGLVSCRSGHHWVIENCTIRHARGVGLDCGSEGGTENMENPGFGNEQDHGKLRERARDVGYHLIRGNRISDHGHCGIAGIGHYGTRVIGNVIERNNRDGWTSPWWEFAGIKFHFFFDGLIEGNLIRDNDAHGIWIDNQWRGSRITRNVIVNNLWSGINVELGRGPVLIDHNVIALTRQGDGVYGHDVADVTIAHNLLYANAGFGVWFAYATPRVKPEDGCWDIRALNNLILGNRAGAVALPTPWEAAGNNIADGNLYSGAGEYLDEGSGSKPALFELTSTAHMGKMQEWLKFRAMTPERLTEEVLAALRKAGVPEDRLPNPALFREQFLVSFEQWRAATGNDAHSAMQMKVIRDGLAAQRLSWQFDLDQTLREVECVPVPAAAMGGLIRRDFHGRPLPKTGRLPGPFQGLAPGRQHLLLWPVPEVGG